MMNDRIAEPALVGSPLQNWMPASGGGTLPFAPPGGAALGAPDGVRPNWFGANGLTWGDTTEPAFGNGSAYTATSNSMSAILNRMMCSVQQLIAKLGSSLGGTAASTGTTFQNATLSSAGDPHLSVTGTEQNADGSTSNVNSHYDSMTGHADLFSSGDFGDGFNVSTAVTAPNAAGVTLNQSATATMEGGLDSVTLDNAGNISVANDGVATTISSGQTIALAGGAQVSENPNGSVTIAEANGNGETLTTTFARNGNGGVDVTAQAHGGVTLGGDLVAGA